MKVDTLNGWVSIFSEFIPEKNPEYTGPTYEHRDLPGEFERLKNKHKSKPEKSVIIPAAVAITAAIVLAKYV